jgi:hypothetical protein
MATNSLKVELSALSNSVNMRWAISFPSPECAAQASIRKECFGGRWFREKGAAINNFKVALPEFQFQNAIPI